MACEGDVEEALLPKTEQYKTTLLYKYLESDPVNKQAVTNFVRRNPNILTEKYKEHGGKNILQVACSKLAKNICKMENIDVLYSLISVQSLFYANATENGNEAIHYACLSRRPEILTLIVKEILKIEPARINARTCDNKTALQFLVSKKNPIDSIECINILIKNGIDVNIPDNDNVIPLLHALKKLENYNRLCVNDRENKSQEREVTKKIVSLLINEGKSFLHSHKLNKKSPKDYIVDLGLDISVDRADPEQEDDVKVFGYLKENHEDMLLKYINIRNYIRSDDGIVTLLQLACIKGYIKSVKFLLKNGADVSTCTEKNDFPIVIAARNGHFEIIKVLLEHHHKYGCLGKAVLELTKRLYEKNNKVVNHEKCLNMLLHKKSIDVNYCDEDGMTPLHCASKLRKTDVCLKLLQKGVLLSIRDNDGNTPIEYLNCSTLKKHFDSCIYYSTLDHFHNPWTSREDREVGKTIKLDYTSILPKMYDDKAKNIRLNVLYDMSEKSELTNVFDHPLITSFLDFKFLGIVKMYQLNMFAYTLYCILLCLQIFLVYMNETHVFIEILLYFFWFLLLTAFVIRILIQVWSQFNLYIKNPDNYIELILFVFTLLILFDFQSNCELKNEVAAITIILAAYELLIYMGQLPTFSTNVKMLKKVTCNFVKFMVWYCCLIFGFALSFYILFRKNNARGDTRKEPLPSNTTNSEQVDFFGNFWFTIVKALVMLTGEFDAASMPLELYPITGVLIFMMFVLMISIVVFNLLNGLAVDDIQEIRRNAIILDNMLRVKQMASIESSIKKLSNVKFKLNLINKMTNTLSDWIYSNEIFKEGKVEITVEGRLYHKEEHGAKPDCLNTTTLDKIKQLIDLEKVEDQYIRRMENTRQKEILEKVNQSVQVLLDTKLKEPCRQLDKILAALTNSNTSQ